MRYGDVARAVWLYELLLWLEPDRPQPYRNLALALATRADASAVQADRVRDYTRAVDLLNEIVTRPWTESFDGIEVISLMEANRIIPKLRALGARRIVLDRRFIAAMDVDLRVVLEWNTNATDMDLWVDEPSGERAIYSNPKTGIGGRLSNDMTAGYGPEEYMLRRAPNGTYTVRVHGFAPDRLNPNGATTVRARIYRNYGRANESEETLEIELTREPQGGSEARDVRRGAEGNAHLVGTIEVGGR
jgi:hypothetical protein